MKNLFLSFLLLTFFFISVWAQPPNCATAAVDPTKCVICNDNFFLHTDSLCYPVIALCAQMEAPGLCKVCPQNYVLSLSKKSCQLPISNCDPLGQNDNSECVKCLTGFSPSLTKKFCVKAITGCTRYDDLGACLDVKNCVAYDAAGVCTGCIPDFALSDTKKTCQPVRPGCKTYSDAGKCLDCLDPANVLSDTALSCQKLETADCSVVNDNGLCSKCLDSVKVPQAANKLDCPPPGCTSKCFEKLLNCISFAPDGNCNKCAVGFIAKGKNCYKEIPQCINMNMDGTCGSCIAGFSVSITKLTCVRSVTNCAVDKILADGKCSECLPEFQLTTLGTCIPKDPNCGAFDTLGCKLCQDGFVKIGDLCVKQIPFCPDLKADGTCNQCQPGFVLSGDNKKCFKELKGCSTYSPLTGLCTACSVAADKLSGSGLGCFMEIANCLAYDDRNGDCLACAATFALSKSHTKCVTAVANCQIHGDDGKCLVCEAGKALDATSLCTGTPVVENIVTPTINLNGAGQLVLYTGTSTLCLIHPMDVVAGAISLGATAPVLKFAPCDSDVLEHTLWAFVDPATGEEFGAPINQAKIFGAADASKNFAIIPKFTAAVTKVTYNSKDYTNDKLRIYSNALNVITLSLEGFTEFTVAPVTGKLGENAFEPAFSLKISKNMKVTLNADPTIAGTVAADTTALASQPNNAKFLVSNTVAPFYKLDAAAGTNFFDFLPVLATNDPAKPFDLKNALDQKITIQDDLITIEWTPKLPSVTLKNIFPVLQGPNKVPTTQINFVCNSRFPESSLVPFQFLYKQGTLKMPEGKPDEDNLIKIALVNFPIWKLIDCGFTPVTVATSGVSTLSGKVGYYVVSDDINDGYFRNLNIEMGLQTARRDVRIENMNLYELFKQDADLSGKILFNSQIRFFEDTLLKKEILGPFNPDARGLLVNNSNIFAVLRLVSSDADAAAPAPVNSDPAVAPFKPLLENYKITAVKAFLLKKTKVDGNDAVVKLALTIPAIVNKEPNTAVVTLDLKNVAPGKYSLIFEYTLLNFRQPGGKRVLEVKKEEIGINEVLNEKEQVGLSSKVDFQYKPPSFEALNLGKLVIGVALALFTLIFI